MVYNNDGCFVLRLSFGIMSNFHGDIRLKKTKEEKLSLRNKHMKKTKKTKKTRFLPCWRSIFDDDGH